MKFRSARLAWGTYLGKGMSVHPGLVICIAVYDPQGTKDRGRDGPIGICDLLGIHPTREKQYKGGDGDRKQSEGKIRMHVNFCHLFRRIQSGNRPQENEMEGDVEQIELQEHFANQERYQCKQLEQKHYP